MNNENEIERMAKVLFLYQDDVCGSCGSEQTCKELGYGECGIFDSMAKDLINVGIGDKKQAVKEFAEKLKYFINSNTAIGCLRRGNKEEFIAEFSCTPYAMTEFIDNLITELCGGE